MNDQLNNLADTKQNYTQRKPEMLVLEGYRHWCAGFETGSIQPWEMAWQLYTNQLGPEDGRKAMNDLSHFIRTLVQSASCPLRSFPFQAKVISVEECVTLGLIAGLQHEADTVELCLNKITCASRCEIVLSAAETFAETLSSLDQILLPVPAHVIEDISARQKPIRYH